MFFLLLSLLTFSSLSWSGDPCASYCTEVRNEIDRLNCLADKKDELSLGCKKELVRLNQLVKDTGARGGGLSAYGGVMGGLGLIPPEKSILTVEGNTAWEGNPTVINQGKVGLTSPLYKKNGSSVTTTLSAGNLHFNEAVDVPEGESIDLLHRVEMGGQYTRMTPEKKVFGLRGSVGSAADKPFATDREFIFTANAFYAPPSEKDSMWMYTLFVSNNNPIANYVPIPGFIYFTKKETFTGMFGLPFMSIQWTPWKRWLFSASLFLINVKTSVSYIFSEKTQLSVGFSSMQQTFLREEREDFRDRLFFNEKRLYTGIRQVFGEVVGELQGGIAFDRSLREGRRFNDYEWRSDLGRSAFVNASMILSFD